MKMLVLFFEHPDSERYPNHDSNVNSCTYAKTKETGSSNKLTAEQFDAMIMGQYESVNHPSHYTQGKYEVIDVIEDWDLGFHLSNALKYIARANYKGNREQDLRKAIWYIQREIGLNKK